MIKRVGKKIVGKVKGKWSSMKNRVKNSFVGKSFRAVVSVVKKVFNVAKTFGKAFLKVSHFIGKKVV